MESKYQNSLINNIKESTFQKVVNTFYNNCKFGGRYQSWEHCKNFFDNNKFPIEDFYKADLTLEDWKNKEKEIEKDECNKNKLDSMCLHLAFYLASWGMYRGSAFILQYDYRKHKKAVLTLLQGKYEHLWIVNKDSQDSEDKFFQNQDKIELIFGNKKQKKFGLINELKECYKGNGEYEDDEPTHTLITKIIMGTMGCIPAFDRYLEAGLKKEGISSKLNEDTYKVLLEMCGKKELFSNLEDCKYYGKYYPKMKLIDMYFWELGYEQDVLNWLEEIIENKEKGFGPKIIKRTIKKLLKLYNYFVISQIKDENVVCDINKDIVDKIFNKDIVDKIFNEEIVDCIKQYQKKLCKNCGKKLCKNCRNKQELCEKYNAILREWESYKNKI